MPGFVAPASSIPNFGNFYQSYFGNSCKIGNPGAGKMLENMKRCYENNSTNPIKACAHYINGFKRMSC